MIKRDGSTMADQGDWPRGRGSSLAGAIAALVAFVILPAAAQAQVEISGSFGYGFSEGVDVTRGTLLSEFVDNVTVGNGLSFGGGVKLWVSETTQVGLQFGLQDSSLGVKGSSSFEITSMNVYTYQGTATYHAGSSGSSVRPFVTVGLGATQYAPSDAMGMSFDSEWRVSGSLGGGVKAYANERIGFGLTARWTPTYIKSDSGGVYCSPFWSPYYGGGCAVLAQPDFSNQLGLTGEIILRL